MNQLARPHGVTLSDDAQAAQSEVTFDRRTLLRILLGIAVLVVGAGVAVAVARHVTGRDNLFGLIPLFDLDGDGNLPAAFSALLLLSAAAVCAVNARADRDRPQGRPRHWRFLALAFVVMTVDELAGLHEFLDRPTAALVGGGDGGLLTFAWVLPAAILVLGLAVAYLPFLAGLPRSIAVRMVLAGAVYVLGAVGLDAVSGSFWAAEGRGSAAYMATSIVEETAEIVGLLLFIDAALRYLAARSIALQQTWTFR